MKFSITKLEIARPDPVAFVKNINEEEPGYGYPKSFRWLDSICEYHHSRNLSQSITFLQSKFSNRQRNAKNIREEEKLTQSLINYVSEHNLLKYIYKSHRLLLNIKLSDKVEMGGLIWLINSTENGGLATYTLTDTDNLLWFNELKYPIIQNYLANKFKCSSDDVAVGIINYTTGKHEQRIYSKEDIQIATEELFTIGAKMSSVL